jgi:hypothetical protein
MLFAMYCQNGHRLAFVDPKTGGRDNARNHDFFAKVDPSERWAKLPKFCAECGTKGISQCPECNEFIGYEERRPRVPNYCTDCGYQFPWVTTSLQELSKVTDEAADLTADEKAALKQAYPELTRNTPKTRGAVETLKLCYAKFSPAAVSVLRSILISVGTDEAKQGLAGLFQHIR